MAENRPAAGSAAATTTTAPSTTTPAPRERTTMSLNRGQVVLLAEFIQNAPAALQDMNWDDATNTSGYHSVEHARAAFKRLKKRILEVHKALTPAKPAEHDDDDEDGPPPGKKAKLSDSAVPDDEVMVSIKTEDNGADEGADLAAESKKKTKGGKKTKAVPVKPAAKKPAKKASLDQPRKKIPVIDTNSPDPALDEINLFSVKGPTAAATKKMAAKLKAQATAKDKKPATIKKELATSKIKVEPSDKIVPDSEKNTSADESSAEEDTVAPKRRQKPIRRELTHTPSRTPSPGLYGGNNFDPDKDSDADLTDNTPNPPSPPPPKRTRKQGRRKRIDISELLENPLDEPVASHAADKGESPKASSSGKKGRAPVPAGKKLPSPEKISQFGGKKLPSPSPPPGKKPPAGKTPALAPRFSTKQPAQPTSSYEEDPLDYGEDTEDDEEDDTGNNGSGQADDE